MSVTFEGALEVILFLADVYLPTDVALLFSILLFLLLLLLLPELVLLLLDMELRYGRDESFYYIRLNKLLVGESSVRH